MGSRLNDIHRMVEWQDGISIVHPCGSHMFIIEEVSDLDVIWHASQGIEKIGVARCHRLRIVRSKSYQWSSSLEPLVGVFNLHGSGIPNEDNDRRCHDVGITER
jgi:hypothetical protein